MSVRCCRFLLQLICFMARSSPRWTIAHELLVKQQIRKDRLAMAVDESEAMLRWDSFL